MNLKKIITIVGTRPNFIKVTQFAKYLNKSNDIDHLLIHTGQHYDNNMSKVFFDQFNLYPDLFLNSSGETPIQQIADIIIQLEKAVKKFQPDLMIGVGDVNSTLAGALVANKLGIKLAHLESGLRSFDIGMPEENNRIITDSITDYYFVSEPSGIENLKFERKKMENMFFIGNTMIDTLVGFKDKIETSTILEELDLNEQAYALMTMHRPATVDNIQGLTKLIEIIEYITSNRKLVFPLHPRTLNQLKKHNLHERLLRNGNIIETPPMDYFSFQKLISKSKFVITDSGGIQEETTFLKVPCITLRPNTERPITTKIGSNVLCNLDFSKVKEEIRKIESSKGITSEIPENWDGAATQRMFEVVRSEILASLV